MRSHTTAPALLLVACAAVLAGCTAAAPSAAPSSAGASPESSSPTPRAATPSPIATAWQEGDLTMEGGAGLPEGLDTIVVNSFTGADGWELSPESTPFVSTYVHATTQCIATHGVLALPAASDVGDLEASADFLGSLQRGDIDGVEPIVIPMPFAAGMIVPVAEPADLHEIEMAAYPAAGDDSATIWAVRALERVGKGFLFALTCSDAEELGGIFEEAKGLVTFGLYDPAVVGLP